MATRTAIANVQGLRETIAAFKAAPADVRKIIEAELRDAVAPIVAGAKARVPRSGAKRSTGERRHLEDTIRAKVIRRGVMVGTPVSYAMIVHFGRRSTQRSRSGTPYTRALSPTPWLYPAVDANRERVRADVQRALQHGLDRLFGAP